MKDQKAFNEITSLIKNFHSIAKNSLDELSEIVDDIILSYSKDEKHIEHTLDRLLDICFDDEVLLVYKKLCRYYYKLNPEATIDYIKFYHDLYDEN